MPHDLPKAYDPTAIEDHWAAYWVREKLFAQPTPAPGQSQGTGDESAGKSDVQPAFVVLLPPPNVTGYLHMGHMLEHTEIDILVRWRRMLGDKVLWVPGTDHAGISTQMLVERQLVSEGTSRQKLGREAFVERTWEWRRHYGGAILEQMKRLGVSVDWSREYFTMDEHLSLAVREAFVRLYHQGLIYRGAYIVNWCPGCQTAVSDLEVVHQEQKGHLWEIKYPVLGADGKDSGEFLTVATTRPETMLGDTAVAIHPEDERYLHLHGKKLRLPLVNREIPIVLDEWVSREFGTGAVKVTPAHDPNDFALGERHHLPAINVMDDQAHINAEGGPYAGLDRYVARKHIVHDLEEQGLLAAVKDYTNNVGHCDRCKSVIEPRLSTQWFIAVNKTPDSKQPNQGGASMAELAIAAVKPDANGKKAIRITPEMHEKVYLEWMTNIHDWCISRQLWWGHRIPAWHCSACHKITVPEPNSKSDPTACAHCGSGTITQETDVLDTWFSSGLLPVSIFGWPDITAETRAQFDAFYPTSLLVTGFDILFFWVARMIMFGCWFSRDVPMRDGGPRPLAESVPYREVYIHALVRDANREKMSKTKGNVVNPIEIVKQYGTDAVRFTLASMASPGTDIAFNVARTEGYRAFANKIWNAARFIFMNVDRAAEIGITVDRATLGQMPSVSADAPLEARWIVAELHATAAKVNQALENYRFDDAANTIYQFFWGSFCDWYLEIVKLRLDFKPWQHLLRSPNEEVSEDAKAVFEGNERARGSLGTLLQVFEAALRLLSPFMPFLTEELWYAVYDSNPPAKSIALTRYPQADGQYVELKQDHGFYTLQATSRGATLEMMVVQKVITALRALRKDAGVPEKEAVDARVYCTEGEGSLTMGYVTREPDKQIINALAKVRIEVRFQAPLSGGFVRSETGFDVEVVYERTVDAAAERERLTKDIAKYEKGLAAAERQLGNEGFLAKAPANLVEGLKKQEAETRLLLEKAQATLRALPKS
jgi:valyl-tRNA synthetase